MVLDDVGYRNGGEGGRGKKGECYIRQANNRTINKSIKRIIKQTSYFTISREIHPPSPQPPPHPQKTPTPPYKPLLPPPLHLIHLIKRPKRRRPSKQLPRRITLRHRPIPIPQHDNPVKVQDRLQPVRNGDDGVVGEFCADDALH